MRSAKLAAAVSLSLLSVLLTALLPAVGAAEAPVPIGPSAIYQRLYRAEVPWTIHVVEADLSEDYIEVRALLGGGEQMARRQLSGMLAAAESEIIRPVAAVNADFFSLGGGSYEGIPLGLHVSQGELMTFPDPVRSVFYILDDGSAHIDRLRPNVWLWGPGELLYPVAAMNRPPRFSDVVVFTPRFGEQTRANAETTQIALVGLTGPFRANARISARIASVTVGASQRIPPEGAVLAARGVAAYALRNLKPGDEVELSLTLEGEEGSIREAVGGGPRLVRNGSASVEHQRERFSNGFAKKRHPRSGVGIREGTLVMVAVDGRQPGYSEGMTLYEFADLFIELGCSDAMNLDGGGSATMVVRDRVMNSPSGGMERAVVNGLGLFCSAPLGPPVQLAIEPREMTVLCGERVALKPRGVDEYYNPVSIDPEKVAWEAAPMLGTVSDAGVFTAGETAHPTVGLVMARLGEMETSTVMTVTPAPARVVVTPERVLLGRGGKQQFSMQAYDADNEPMAVPQGRLEWRVEPEGAGCTIDQWGLLRATEGEGQGEVVVLADVGGTRGTAAVVMGTEIRVLEGFESARVWTFRAQPADAPGTVERVADPRRPGRWCLRLQYDLSKGVGTRTAEAEMKVQLPETRAFSVEVLGDGQGGWLRARLRDAAGRGFTVDLANQVNWSGSWRRLTASLPEEAESPVTLESIYLVEYHEDRGPSGAIFLDDIAATPAAPSVTKSVDQDRLRSAIRTAYVPAEAGADGSDSGSKQPKAEAEIEGSEEMSELPTYTCRKTVEPITIDGHLTEGIWSQLESVGDFTLGDGTEAPQLPTEVKMCWDESNLYLAFVAVDTDIWGKMRERDDPIYQEEVVEAFLCSGGDVTRYFEFEFSPHNVVFDAKIECPESGDRREMTADVGWDCAGLQSAVQVVGSLDDSSDVDERWTVEVALPFASIGRDGKPPVDGEEWRGNFYRIDQAGGGEFSCWSPTLVLPPNFHVPARFGRLRFSGESM